MFGVFIDPTAPSLQGKLPKLPQDLPHGLITPPERVRELVAQDKAKYPPHIYNAEFEERVLNQWTLQYYFDYLGYEVLYRQTPAGPEVLGVGFEEVHAYTKGMSLEDRAKLKTWRS